MSSEPPRSDFASISRFLRPPCVLRSQTEQADELPESGTREHDVPFVLHRAPWVGFAHITVVLAHHVTLMCACSATDLSVELAADVSCVCPCPCWPAVCAPCSVCPLLHSSFVFVHLMHLDARLYRAKRVLMDARIAVEVAHHAYDWCTWRKSAIGHLCSRIWPRPYLNACGWRGDSRVAHITHHTGTWAHTRGPGSVLT